MKANAIAMGRLERMTQAAATYVAYRRGHLAALREPRPFGRKMNPEARVKSLSYARSARRHYYAMKEIVTLGGWI